VARVRASNHHDAHVNTPPEAATPRFVSQFFGLASPFLVHKRTKKRLPIGTRLPSRRIVQMSKARKYRDRAEQCRRFAKESISEPVREHWLDLAMFWERLAASEEASEWINPSPIEARRAEL
jgi:hypothetical protein